MPRAPRTRLCLISTKLDCDSWQDVRPSKGCKKQNEKETAAPASTFSGPTLHEEFPQLPLFSPPFPPAYADVRPLAPAQQAFASEEPSNDTGGFCAKENVQYSNSVRELPRSASGSHNYVHGQITPKFYIHAFSCLGMWLVPSVKLS